ncbi:hypothetical protein J2Z70_000310 [Paenibacillus silagei]|uniref:Uncharacterized protein n=1 Tax=Paenibacillus silagei TaxID=1670801 RepID=A0ABS4NJG6_9BACL|nr:hypothetical protein [Paenibacillus silagei]
MQYSFSISQNTQKRVSVYGGSLLCMDMNVTVSAYGSR